MLLLLAGFGFLSGCAADRRQSAEIFGNMTYYVGNEHFAEPVSLKDCEYFSPFLKVHYENKFVYGDFNHDGFKDVAETDNIDPEATILYGNGTDTFLIRDTLNLPLSSMPMLSADLNHDSLTDLIFCYDSIYVYLLELFVV